MKSTGIVRKIDELGRIVLPIEIRNTMDIKSRDPIEIFTDNDKIVLRKYQPSCVFCGKVDNLDYYKEKLVCHKCMEDLARKFVTDKID